MRLLIDGVVEVGVVEENDFLHFGITLFFSKILPMTFCDEVIDALGDLDNINEQYGKRYEASF